MLSHFTANYLPRGTRVLTNSLNYRYSNVIHTGLTSRLYFASSCFILSVLLLLRKGLLFVNHQITNCQTLSIAADIGVGYPVGADNVIKRSEETHPVIRRESGASCKLQPRKDVSRIMEMRAFETSLSLLNVAFLSNRNAS